MSKISRRDLLKTSALTIGLAAITNAENKPKNQSMIGVPFEKRDKVRIGIVGVGERGCSMIHDMNGIENLEIVALCDNVKANAEQGKAMIEKVGKPTPAMYTDGDYAFEKLVQRDDIDFVYSPTPWELHAPVALAAMNALS